MTLFLRAFHGINNEAGYDNAKPMRRTELFLELEMTKKLVSLNLLKHLLVGISHCVITTCIQFHRFH